MKFAHVHRTSPTRISRHIFLSKPYNEFSAGARTRSLPPELALAASRRWQPARPVRLTERAEPGTRARRRCQARVNIIKLWPRSRSRTTARHTRPEPLEAAAPPAGREAHRTTGKYWELVGGAVLGRARLGQEDGHVWEGNYCDRKEPTGTGTTGTERNLLGRTLLGQKGTYWDRKEPTGTGTTGTERNLLGRTLLGQEGTYWDRKEPTGTERNLLGQTLLGQKGTYWDRRDTTGTTHLGRKLLGATLLLVL